MAINTVLQKKQSAKSQRLQFDVLDLFRAASGFERPDGYVVIPRDIGKKIEEEFERLYAVEEAAKDVASMLKEQATPSPTHPAIETIHLLTGLQD